MPGILYIVATPIGNLEDITLRALRILREVDLVACEDTRQTAKLMAHYQIEKPKISYHEHNEPQRASSLLLELQNGKQVALVTDSGTPCISDPGYRIVRNALENGIRVIPIPGPCSLIAALSASGRPTDSFVFLGFLPPRRSSRQAILESLKNEQRTLIFFESPLRLVDALTDVQKVLGDRPLTVAREVTKIYEEFFAGTTGEALTHFSKKPVKGEVILMIEKSSSPGKESSQPDKDEVLRRVNSLVEQRGMSKNEALKELSLEYRVPKRTLYRLMLDSAGKGANH